MSRLALFLLGPPRIERDGVLINVDTRKAIALLAYLTVTHQRHSRDVLASLLWPEYDQTNARGALRRTLSTLNKALAGNWLDIERDTISLDSRSSSNFWLDVDHFYNLLDKCRTHGHPASETCPACVSPLSEAVTLYRDDFRAGFSLRDSPTFDDWQFFQADSLRHDLAATLERLVSCYSAMGDFKPAIAYARRWLALDRLHEPAHRILMQLYAWAGQRSAALHQYRECVQVLEQELGVAPLEATTRLYQAIKENQATPPPPPPRAARPRGVSESARASEPARATELTRVGEPSRATPAVAPTIDNGASSRPSQPLLTTPTLPLVGRSKEWSILLKAYQASRKAGQV